MGIIEIIEIIYTGIMEIIEIMYRLRDWKWPIFLFVIIIIFRKQISEFLQRLKTFKISSIGVEAGTPPDPNQQIKEIKKSLPSEEEIKEGAKKKGFEAFLLKKYTKLSKDYGYEITFNVIFGTQMNLLNYLSKKGTSGEKYINLMGFYNECLKRWRLRYPIGISPTITSYFGFLEDMGYIKYVGEGDERIVKITPHGNDFISYIIARYPIIDYKLARHF